MENAAFENKVSEIRTLLSLGDVKQATEVLNQAWNIAGKDKPKRTVAHDLGNEIQRVIFEQYCEVEGIAQ